jgi:hypothetical protein
MNISEKFNYIEYSDATKFTVTSSGKIQLVQYSDDLIFYVPFDSTTNAKYSAGNPTAVTSGTISITNFGVFAQYGYFQANGIARYEQNNFTSLADEGTVNFRLRAGFNNDPGRQDFVGTTVTPGDTRYYFRLYVGSALAGGDSLFVKLVTSDTMGSIKNKINTKINPFNATSTVLTSRAIRTSATSNGDSCFFLAPVTAPNSLLTLLGGVGTAVIPNGPTATSINFLDFYNGADNKNRIIMTHTGDSSRLQLKMYNDAGTLIVNSDFGIWSNNYDRWYDFELTWNKSIVQLFIDGVLFGVTTTGFTRAGNGIYLYLQSGAADFYRFDELIVYDVQKHSGAFTVPTVALSAYSTANPYIDIHLGKSPKLTEVQDFNLICSDGCYFIVKLGNTWYYYISGSWQASAGTFAESSTPSLMEDKFTELAFNENLDLIIRVFFHSDGVTNVWLSEMEVEILKGSSVQASITGSVSLLSPTNLSASYNVLLSTNVGSATVDCSAGAGDDTAVTLNEIKAAISAAAVPGLATPSDDGLGHLILKTSSYGDSAWISITNATANDGLAIIFGGTASGTGTTPSGSSVDYSELFRYVRSKLGEPTIPVELTDEQMMDCLADATFQFNRWRNAKEKLLYTSLSGSSNTGYDIPAVVGGADNIIEIILKSRYPYSFYAGKSDDIIGNLYVQSIFHKWKSAGLLSDILSDYYLTVSTAEDINIILGTQIKWEIMNNKIFLYPNPPSSLSVGIRYRGALEPSEVVTNYWVRRYVLAESKIVLGNLRSTFKSGIPGGTEMIQLNGEDLKAEGQAEKEALVEDMKKSSEPLFLEWF